MRNDRLRVDVRGLQTNLLSMESFRSEASVVNQEYRSAVHKNGSEVNCSEYVKHSYLPKTNWFRSELSEVYQHSYLGSTNWFRSEMSVVYQAFISAIHKMVQE